MCVHGPANNSLGATTFKQQSGHQPVGAPEGNEMQQKASDVLSHCMMGGEKPWVEPDQQAASRTNPCNALALTSRNKLLGLSVILHGLLNDIMNI